MATQPNDALTRAQRIENEFDAVAAEKGAREALRSLALALEHQEDAVSTTNEETNSLRRENAALREKCAVLEPELEQQSEDDFDVVFTRAVRIVERARLMRAKDDAISHRHIEKPMGEAVQIVVANAPSGRPHDDSVVCAWPQLDNTVLEGGCVDMESLATLPIGAAIREELENDSYVASEVDAFVEKAVNRGEA